MMEITYEQPTAEQPTIERATRRFNENDKGQLVRAGRVPAGTVLTSRDGKTEYVTTKSGALRRQTPRTGKKTRRTCQ